MQSRENIKEFLSSHIIENEILGLYKKEITDEYMPALLEVLNEHPEVTVLDLSKNPITDKAIELLKTNNTIHHVELSKNQNISPFACYKIKQHVANNLKLKSNLKFLSVFLNAPVEFKNHTLDLSEKNITDTDLSCIIKVVNEHPEIVEINLSKNNITNTGMKIIPQLVNILRIDLSGNDFTDGCATVFKYCSFNSINLGNTIIGNNTAQMLSKSPTLNRVVLRDTLIDEDGVLFFKENERLQDFNADDNEDIDDSALSAMKDQIKKNQAALPVHIKNYIDICLVFQVGLMDQGSPLISLFDLSVLILENVYYLMPIPLNISRDHFSRGINSLFKPSVYSQIAEENSTINENAMVKGA